MSQTLREAPKSAVENVGSISNSPSSDIKQNQKTLQLIDNAVKRIEKQELASEKTQSLVTLGFIVVVIMVAAMVVGYIQLIIQTNLESSKRSQETLQSIQDDITEAKETIYELEVKYEQASRVQSTAATEHTTVQP